MIREIQDIVRENERRNNEQQKVFNPLTGEGSLGDRTLLHIDDYALPDQWLPTEMMKEPMVKAIKRKKSIKAYAGSIIDDSPQSIELVTKAFTKLRSKYDFPFWAMAFAKIKNKNGGEDIPFRLNRAQRKLVSVLEKQRKADKPIRVILLKARQWGGSTLVQIYMAWIQLVHKKSWNSTIASHTNQVSATVRGMFSKLIDNYPTWMLYPIGTEIDPKRPKMTSFEGQQGIQIIPSRGCKIRIATANAQDNLRSEDVAMAHCTEVALWPDTTLLHPDDFVDACMSGMLRRPYTMKVLESTAKGSGNYFHKEWVDAKKGIGEYEPVFVSWREIENDRIPFDSDDERNEFAKWLYVGKDQMDAPDRRSESGRYLWHQWEEGATLEGLHWYVEERKGKSSHDHMASEAPSNDLEAFSSTGEELFDEQNVEKMRAACKEARWLGEVQGNGQKGKEAVEDVRFLEDKTGRLDVWTKPEVYPDIRVTHRYVVVVDIGGLSAGADWSVICVIDRYWMMEGGKPTIVAQWYGHIDHDILAWKAAQIASWYDNALLVVESNTLDKERDVNADLSEFILAKVKNAYKNLYERERSEEDIKSGIPAKYGFHTNRATKPKIIKNLQECVRDMLYVERDERCLDEMLTYEHNGQKYEAKQGYHDDLLMTRAIGLWIAQHEMPVPEEVSRMEIDYNKPQLDSAFM